MLHSEHLSCNILLDDAHSSPDNPSSRLYQQATHYSEVNNALELDEALLQIESAIAQNKYVVSCLSYELGEYLVGISPRPSVTPWVRAWIFDEVRKLSKTQADEWLQQHIKNLSLDQLKQDVKIDQALIPSLDASLFSSNVETIQELIRNGDTYQVNFTYRIDGSIIGEPVALYQHLRDKQPGPFGAYIEHADGWVLSCSPEWFLGKRGQQLITKPMKGTGRVGELSSATLSADPKNRAENLMIVDLLRNDFSKISKPGTVKVPQLFQVDQHGDVLQMTSTIESTAKDNLCLKDLLMAIYPCGSITGAPKKRTMEIIQELEGQPRNLYCGSIAWFDPIEHASKFAETPRLGDIGMSVVIRTLEVNKDRQFTMGVGGGITIDSNGESEWHECQTKANFLYQFETTPGLFETIRIEQGKACHIERHLDRLEHSARTLKISFDRHIAMSLVKKACEDLDKSKLTYRMKLALSSGGELSVTVHPTDPICSTVPLLWAQDLFENDVTSQSKNPWFKHKVSERSIYDKAWRKAEQWGSFDALFVNELGFVTEGGRSNLFIKKDGQWQTPPTDSGCLPGVMRSIILADLAWNAVEKNFRPEDVLSAEEIIYCNALRGIINVDLPNTTTHKFNE